MTEQVEQALDHLTELRQRYVHVSTKTNALHEACENALEEQVGALVTKKYNTLMFILDTY